MVSTEDTGRLSQYYRLEEQAKRLPPQHEALWSRDGIYTYREMLDVVNQYAQFFLSRGIKPGQCISFCLTNHREFVIALYAVWAIGCYVSFLNHNTGGEAVVHALRISESVMLLVDEEAEIRGRIEELRGRIASETKNEIVILDKQTKSKIASFEPKRPGDECRAGAVVDTIAMLIFTSGTTGLPKACPFEVKRLALSSSGRARMFRLPYDSDSRWYVCMPMYHGTGICSAIGALASGTTVCIGKRFRNRTFWPDIRDSRATGFVYVGEIARYLVAQPRSSRDKDHRARVVFGNGLRPDVWRTFQDRFGIELINEFFSSSEGVLNLLNQARGDFSATAVGHHGALFRFQTRDMYAAAATDPNNSKELLRDKDGHCIRTPLSSGGEILVKVPGRACQESGFFGYLHNEKATEERFISNVFQDGDLYYRSGDALRRDADGRWFFLDRLGDTFRWKSENISTAEVSEALGSFPGVQEANTYGVLIPGHDGRAGCAALYIDGGPDAVDKFDWAGLAKHSKTRLAKYAVPVFIRVLSGEIHGTHNHKQNKVPLRQQGVDLSKVDSTDRMLWLPPDSDGYVKFRKSDWDRLESKQARL